MQEGYKPYLRELEGRKPIPRYRKRQLATIEEKTECDSDGKMPEVAMDIDENSNSSVQIIEEKNVVSTSVGWRLKLLKFHKNHRPAYYGTMRKTSNHISPRNPFKKDMVTKLITILHKKVDTGCTCIQCCTYCFSLTINTLIYYLFCDL